MNYFLDGISNKTLSVMEGEDYYKMEKPRKCSLWKEIKPRAISYQNFDILEEYIDEPHFSRSLVKCKECGQLYYKEFYEGMDDSLYFVFVPISNKDDLAKVRKADKWDLLNFLPQLRYDFPSTAKESRIFWVKKRGKTANIEMEIEKYAKKNYSHLIERE